MAQHKKLAIGVLVFGLALLSRAQSTILAYLLTTTPDASLKDGKRAVALAKRALELSGGRDSTILVTLAAAHADVERWSDALAAAERARSSADAGTNAAAKKQTRELVAVYRDLASRHEK